MLMLKQRRKWAIEDGLHAKGTLKKGHARMVTNARMLWEGERTGLLLRREGQAGRPIGVTDHKVPQDIATRTVVGRGKGNRNAIIRLAGGLQGLLHPSRGGVPPPDQRHHFRETAGAPAEGVP